MGESRAEVLHLDLGADLGRLQVEAAGITRSSCGKRCGRGHKPIRAAAAALGRRGGLKGGIARAASRSPEKRREIARRAAWTKWKKE